MDRIRGARPEDLGALTEIYNHYVVNTPVTFDLEPFTVAQRHDWFTHVNSGGRHQLIVAERASQVLGWACTQRFRDKGAYAASVESSIYLDPEATGVGLGGRLYTELLARIDREPVTTVVAAITVPNESSLALHRRHGFERVGVMRRIGHKLGREWDVEWWQRLR